MAPSDPPPIYFEKDDHRQTIRVAMFKFSLSVTETVDLDERPMCFNDWENFTEVLSAHDAVQSIPWFESSNSRKAGFELSHRIDSAVTLGSYWYYTNASSD